MWWTQTCQTFAWLQSFGIRRRKTRKGDLRRFLLWLEELILMKMKRSQVEFELQMLALHVRLCTFVVFLDPSLVSSFISPSHSFFRSFSLTQSAVFDSFDPSSLSLLWQELWREIKATSCPCCCDDKVGKKLCTFLLLFNWWLIAPFSSTSSPLLAPVPFFLFLLVHQINSSQVSGFALCTLHWEVGHCGGKLPKNRHVFIVFLLSCPISSGTLVRVQFLQLVKHSLG